MGMKMIYGLVLFFCSINFLGLAAAYQDVSVPRNTNGYNVITAEELKAAEKDSEEGKISHEVLENIRLIHESYPMKINVFVYPECGEDACNMHDTGLSHHSERYLLHGDHRLHRSSCSAYHSHGNWGGDHRFLLPASALVGGLLLLAADTVARTTMAPVILPVGIMTSFLGVPFFVYLFLRRKKEFW
jgi:hypothetical protein